MLDPRTTVLIGGITCGLMALVLTFLKRAAPLPVPALRSWVVGAWLVFAALVLLGLRDLISSLASVTLGNTALILAYVVWLGGTQEHFGGRARWLPWIGVVVGTALGLTWFDAIDHSFRIRVVIVAGLCAAINARHAFVLRRVGKASSSERGIGASITITWLALLTLVYGLRAGHALVLPQGNSGLLTQDVIQVIYTASFTVCNLMLVIGFATMASDHVRVRIEEQAIRDPLTGVLNRRALFASMEREMSRSQRGGHTFCVAMLDIDHFKRINDQHGHPVGDRVLVDTCERTASLIRPHDVFARYGGEEFLILMPETAMPAALHAAERIRNALAVPADASLPAITVSLGLAEWTPSDATVEDLVARADQALYAAKAGGRNRVHAHRSSDR
ncbi:hypothetical protein CDN99_12470 [Roseateles aquatilis]|jgi:diguanylate cyclase (GGDEF)-like protein|uniref:diguanylate cyclase n=2 Tax=Roseateles aquatilis TaxID=431061 RepID=A0A246JE85_9BURK|nr:hypothetical protein CDN99_12470 [Roseateles aquatilis]